MSSAAPWSVGSGATAALLAAWIAACDLWVKILSRAAGCPGSPEGAGARIGAAYGEPGECESVPLLGDTLSLHASSTGGGPFGLLEGSPGGAMGSMVGLAILAAATIVTIVVWRWRWRSSGDPLALGVLWGGALVLAAPRLSGGERVTELALGSMQTGLGDLAIVWAGAWLAWRAIAEARA